MKAYLLEQYGKTASLKLKEVAQPTIGDKEILVKIHAAGINPLDVRIRNGEFKRVLRYKLPLILGHDLSGVVTQVGKNVTRFQAGDAIMARAADFRVGSFAEYIALNEDDAAMKPANVSMEAAASIPLVGLTAWQALVEIAKLKKGQRVFIQAGSGGLGTAAIQLAKHLGATIATTASKSSFDFLKELGADIVIDYKSDDFEKILAGYDVALHSQHRDSLYKSIEILKPGGTLISVDGPPDPVFIKQSKFPWYVKVILSLLGRKVFKVAKREKIHYAFLYMQANGAQLTEIGKLMRTGNILPVIDKVFSFDEVNQAMVYQAGGHAKGKIVIKVT